jgi:hypothetical protein
LDTRRKIVDPDVSEKKRIAEGSGVSRPLSPAEFGKFMRDDAEKCSEVIEFAGFAVRVASRPGLQRRARDLSTLSPDEPYDNVDQIREELHGWLAGTCDFSAGAIAAGAAALN